MKALLLVWSILVVSCQVADSELSTKVLEMDRNGDGRKDHRVETVSRGKANVMRTVRKEVSQGKWVTSRDYFVKGKLVMTELDDDGDGGFELFVVYTDGQKDLEAFERASDGTITPAEFALVQRLKRQNEAVAEFWDNAMEAVSVKSALEEQTRKAQEKIQQK